jgi:hypothetical protein
MRIRKNIKYLICQSAFLIFMLFAVACDDHGIEPRPPESSGFSGTVWFLNEWPDSIKRAFIVVFENPLLTPADFTISNLKFLSREIPLDIPKYEFSSLDSAYIPATPGPFPSGTYAYVAVVQQSTDELSLARKDWFVSGVYYAPGDTSQPGKLVIPDSTFVRNINIYVDFNNPPPQPPGYN